MTLKDVRAFAWLAADWCVSQDDLTGFSVSVDPKGIVTVRLEWIDGIHLGTAYQRFTTDEIGVNDESWMIDSLRETANRMRDDIAARARARKLANPDRLPG